MPIVTFDIERAGYAEQFVQNLQSTMPDGLTQLTEEIKNDIAVNAPKGGGKYNPKVGDTPLSESFDTIPAQQVGESVWESYITSSVPAKARSLEYGSGLQGPRMSKYPITPKSGRFLVFQKEGRTLRLPFVMHPGVYGQFYINETLRVWRPAVAQRFGTAIRLAAVAPKRATII